MDTTSLFLTLEELSATVGQLLDRYGLRDAQRDARVSAIPDARTIRYYTTLGLLDSPTVQGRQARYQRRHVLQLLAIKALQGASLTLGEIQERLYGRTDEELEQLAASLAQQQSDAVELRPVVWREIVIEPGLKIVADEHWFPGNDIEAILNRIRAALTVLQASDQRGKRRE